MLDINNYVSDGYTLEIFTASVFQACNYYVDCNLKVIEERVCKKGSVDILEIDILARKYTKENIELSIVECKRGCTFEDLFKFVGISQYIKPEKSILVCQSNQLEEIKEAGLKTQTDVFEPNEIFYQYCAKEKILDMFYQSNLLINSFYQKNTIVRILKRKIRLSKKEKDAFGEVKKYLIELIGRIWKIPNSIEKANAIYHLITSNKDFVRRIASTLYIREKHKKSESYMMDNPICLAAAFIVLKARIAYIISTVEVALQFYNGQIKELDDLEDENQEEMIMLLAKNIETAVLIPNFLQTLVYIFGGVLSLVDEDDKENISSYMGTSFNNIINCLDLIERLFQIGKYKIQWGFTTDMKVLSFRYTPNPLKGYGILNRKKLGFSTENFSFSDEWIESLNDYRRKR